MAAPETEYPSQPHLEGKNSPEPILRLVRDEIDHDLGRMAIDVLLERKQRSEEASRILREKFRRTDSSDS